MTYFPTFVLDYEEKAQSILLYLPVTLTIKDIWFDLIWFEQTLHKIMNLWLVALCLRCNIALRARAHTSHALIQHACWSHFTLWVSVITTTKWVTTWCSEEVNWFINIWVEESISTSRAVHKGCASILFIFRRMDFCRLLPGRKCWGCFFLFPLLGQLCCVSRVRKGPLQS